MENEMVLAFANQNILWYTFKKGISTSANWVRVDAEQVGKARLETAPTGLVG